MCLLAWFYKIASFSSWMLNTVYCLLDLYLLFVGGVIGRMWSIFTAVDLFFKTELSWKQSCQIQSVCVCQLSCVMDFREQKPH